MNLNYTSNALLSKVVNITEPINNGGNSSTTLISAVGQLIFLVVVFGLVIFLAYFSTRWIATAKYAKKGGNLNVIESMMVGQQNSIQLIKAGKKILLIGITKENISLITELSEQDIVIPNSGQQTISLTFDRYLKKHLHKNFNKKKPDDDEENENTL